MKRFETDRHSASLSDIVMISVLPQRRTLSKSRIYVLRLQKRNVNRMNDKALVSNTLGFSLILLALLAPALLNGSPIWFPDSVEYIQTGYWFWQSVLFGKGVENYGQRSIWYSAILFCLHWNINTWPVAFFHGFLVATNSLIVLRIAFPQMGREGRLVSVLLLLLVATLVGG